MSHIHSVEALEKSSQTFWMEFSRQYKEEIHLLIDRYQRSDPLYQEELFSRILRVLTPLIRHTASANLRRRPGTGHSLDDFIVFVELAVHKAVRSYRSDRNDNFFGYLFTVVNNEVIKSVQAELSVPRNIYRNMTSDRMRQLEPNDPVQTVYHLLHTDPLDLNDYQSTGAVPGIDVVEMASPPTESDGQMVLEELL